MCTTSYPPFPASSRLRTSSIPIPDDGSVMPWPLQSLSASTRRVIDVPPDGRLHRGHTWDAGDEEAQQVDVASRLETPAKGDDAVFHVDVHPTRVEPENPLEHVVADLLLELVVRARECPDEVGPRDDADQLALLHDREPVHAAGGHQPCRFADALVRRDRERGRGHGRPCRQRPRLRVARVPGAAGAEPGERPPAVALVRVVLFVEDVALRDHSEHVTLDVADGQPGDAVLHQDLRDVLDRSLGPIVRTSASSARVLSSQPPFSRFRAHARAHRLSVHPDPADRRCGKLRERSRYHVFSRRRTSGRLTRMRASTATARSGKPRTGLRSSSATAGRSSPSAERRWTRSTSAPMSAGGAPRKPRTSRPPCRR